MHQSVQSDQSPRSTDAAWDYKCDVCKCPATHAARDYYVVRDTPHVSTVESYQPANVFKFGCDNHPVKSRMLGEV